MVLRHVSWSCNPRCCLTPYTLSPCRCAGTKVLLSHYKHCTSAEGCLLCDPVRSLTTGEHAVAGLPWPLPGAAAAGPAAAEERTPAPPVPSTRCEAPLHRRCSECTAFSRPPPQGSCCSCMLFSRAKCELSAVSADGHVILRQDVVLSSKEDCCRKTPVTSCVQLELPSHLNCKCVKCIRAPSPVSGQHRVLQGQPCCATLGSAGAAVQAHGRGFSPSSACWKCASELAAVAQEDSQHSQSSCHPAGAACLALQCRPGS